MQGIFNWYHPLLCKMNKTALAWIVLLNVIVVNMLAILNLVAVVIADSSMQGDLVIDQTRANWISLIFLIATAMTVPIASWAAERFGYKRIFFGGVALFMIGSTLSGLSTHYYEMIFFRVISGLGTGCIFPLSLTIIGLTFPKEKITLALSLYIAIAFGMGASLGFYIGGYFTEFLNWRMIFFLNIIFGPINLLLTWLMQMETEPKNGKKFDTFGYLCFLTFVISILVLADNIKAPWNTQGWTSHFAISFYILGAISFILFIFREKSIDYPIFTLSLFRNKSYFLGCFAVAMIGMLFFGTALTFPALLEDSFQYSKSSMGDTMIPYTLSFGLVGAASGYIAKVINVKILALLGIAIVAMSCFINHSITIQSDQYEMQTFLILRGVGIGLSLGPLTALALSELPQEHLAEGGVTVTIFRQVGASFGGSIMALIQIIRRVFHTIRFGEQIDVESAAYQQFFSNLQQHIINNTGANSEIASAQTEQYLIANVQAQANILALNDALFLFGWALIILGIFIALTMIHTCYKKRSTVIN